MQRQVISRLARAGRQNNNNLCFYKKKCPFISTTVASPRCSSTTTSSSSSTSSSTNNTTTDTTPPVVRYLDLSGSGLSILERLVLEECLYQTATQHNWLIAGTHGARNVQRPILPQSTSTSITKSDGAIVLGIGGKIDQLLYTDQVKEDAVTVIRRFSGGGTVLMEENCVWTTLIGRNFPTTPPYYPRPLMEYTAQALFGPLFDELNHRQQQRQQQRQSRASNNHRKTLVQRSNSCGGLDASGTVSVDVGSSNASTTPQLQFLLQEHDYVLVASSNDNNDTDDTDGGNTKDNQANRHARKMGGNAQSIGKHGWLHHTSFLWQLPEDMQHYLRLPSKRPEYRQDRSHQDFLVSLSEVYPHLQPKDFIAALKHTSQSVYQLEVCSTNEVLHELEDTVGGLANWYEKKSRTRVVTEF